MIDPEKRSVELLSYTPKTNSFDLLGHTTGPSIGLLNNPTKAFSPLHRVGFPDFKHEVIKPGVPSGSCAAYEGRFYVWREGRC